jgi:hypothetical protein
MAKILGAPFLILVLHLACELWRRIPQDVLLTWGNENIGLKTKSCRKKLYKGSVNLGA